MNIDERIIVDLIERIKVLEAKVKRLEGDNPKEVEVKKEEVKQNVRPAWVDNNKGYKSNIDIACDYIYKKIDDAKEKGYTSVVLVSGQIHKELGWNVDCLQYVMQ